MILNIKPGSLPVEANSKTDAITREAIRLRGPFLSDLAATGRKLQSYEPFVIYKMLFRLAGGPSVGPKNPLPLLHGALELCYNDILRLRAGEPPQANIKPYISPTF